MSTTIQHLLPNPEFRKAKLVDAKFFDVFRLYKDDQAAFEQAKSDTIAIVLAPKLMEVAAELSEEGTIAGAEPLTRWMLDVVRSQALEESQRLLLTLITEENPHSLKGMELAREERLVGLTLAKCCPHDLRRRNIEQFLDITTANHGHVSIAQAISRKDFRYGVFTCDPQHENLVSEPLVGLALVKYSVTSRDSNPANLYLQLMSLFDMNKHIVYVQGLETAEDLFLKWCCEYTYRFPWRFFYFENLDIRYNYPEICDRFQTLGRAVSLEIRPEELWHRKFAAAAPTGSIVDAATVEPPSMSEDWAAEIKATLRDSKRCVILLVSPPGAGKSHMAHELIAEDGNRGQIHRFDCSDDRLVMQSLPSMLDRSFLDSKPNSVLIADEYHLLGPRQKTELFEWFTARLSWLKVLLIGNRTLTKDKQLLDDLRRRTKRSHATESRASTKIRHYEVVLTPDMIAEVCGADFLTYWYQLLNGLFGPSLLSLRDGFSLAKHKDDADLGDKLSHQLLQKAPYLGKYLTNRVGSLFGEYKAADYASYVLADKAKGDIVAAICLAALSSPIQPLQHFMLEAQQQEVPPLKRASQWLEHNGHTCPVNIDTYWIDQEPFPCVVLRRELEQIKAIPSDATVCLALGISGDYSDLKWLRSCAVHGRSINWTKAKQAWTAQPLSDLDAFESLLQDCSNRHMCLTSCQDDNLIQLAERSFRNDQEGIGFIIKMQFDVAKTLSGFVLLPTKARFHALWRGLLAMWARGDATENCSADYIQVQNIMHSLEDEHAIGTIASAPHFFGPFAIWLANEGMRGYHSYRDSSVSNDHVNLHLARFVVNLGLAMEANLHELLSAERVQGAIGLLLQTQPCIEAVLLVFAAIRQHYVNGESTFRSNNSILTAVSNMLQNQVMPSNPLLDPALWERMRGAPALPTTEVARKKTEQWLKDFALSFRRWSDRREHSRPTIDQALKALTDRVVDADYD
jgi:hypothetical protein